MSCIVWNARGLGNQRAFRELKRLFAEKNPSLLFLSETKLRDYQCRWWKNVLGFSGMFVVNCLGRSGGLMLMWKEPLDVRIQSYKMGHIDCTVRHFEKLWRFTGFYGNLDSNKRHLSWDLLLRLHGMPEYKSLPWLVGGDFNEVCFDTKKMGGNLRSFHQTLDFRDILDTCSLQDLHGSGDFFTWVNRRHEGELIFEGLDRYVGTFEWRIL
ncbi:uncharacterized protein LOC142507719 [Primulina tabacum]|uniref:uncharacterized protein LOC142507719 n=1 Tax=Primulina tabacum TaxID=48773 RepID=UPI003F59E177